MTSFRQIETNRRNARKSTGPITEEGKQRSRCKAVSHGLTAETVIGALEDAEDYNAFQAAVAASFDAKTAVERELVLRLASLLWRLCRVTAIDTGFIETPSEPDITPDLDGGAPANERAAAGTTSLENRCMISMTKARMTPLILQSRDDSCSSTPTDLSGSDAMKQRCDGKCISKSLSSMCYDDRTLTGVGFPNSSSMRFRPLRSLLPKA
jgi:hypothetical protein